MKTTFRDAPPAPEKRSCGPRASDCQQMHVAFCQATGVNVYRCEKCGSEEWL